MNNNNTLINDVLLNQLILDFNSTLLTLALNIAHVCPKSLIGTNIKTIERSIKNANNFTKFIDLFCIKVLKYKSQIDVGDESFFMNKTYDNDINGVVDITKQHLDQVITLKSVWFELKQENKEIVISYMQILCALSQEYFNIISTNSS